MSTTTLHISVSRQAGERRRRVVPAAKVRQQGILPLHMAGRGQNWTTIEYSRHMEKRLAFICRLPEPQIWIVSFPRSRYKGLRRWGVVPRISPRLYLSSNGAACARSQEGISWRSFLFSPAIQSPLIHQARKERLDDREEGEQTWLRNPRPSRSRKHIKCVGQSRSGRYVPKNG